MQHEMMLHIKDMTVFANGSLLVPKGELRYENDKGSVVLTVGEAATITTARGTYTLVKHPSQNYYAGMVGDSKAHVIPGKPVAGRILHYRLIYWTKEKQAV